MKKDKTNKAIIVTSLTSFLILSRLFYLQVLSTDTEIKTNYISTNEISNVSKSSPFDRNKIFFTDRNNNPVLAAAFDESKRLFISPAEIDDPIETYEHLSTILELDENRFMKSVNKGSLDEYEVVKDRIGPSVAKRVQKRIRQYGIRGVYLEENEKRVYPLGSLGSHILGFVGYDNEGRYGGVYGLEAYYDKILSTPIENKDNSDLSNIIRKLGTIVSAGEERGGDLYTSIEPTVQEQLELEILKINSEWDSTQTSGIVMDPHTGDILAMSTVPTFNSNEFSKERDFTIFNNPLIESTYEMGSIFKPLTIAIGLDSNSITLEDTYDDKGFIESDTHTISNHDGKAYGEGTTIQDVINKSLNTGAAFVVEKTGKDIFQSYMKSFDFGNLTGIDLPREIWGNVENLDSPRMVEYFTVSYGHGIATTPIGVLRALATLANNGNLVTPKIVKEIDRRGDRIINPSSEAIKVFDTDTTDAVTELLINGFDNALLGGTLRDSNYTFATKTGTALAIDKDTREYDENKRLHTFFGYFPARDPKFIVLLYTFDPKEAEYASETLARPFKSFADFMISYYQLPPDRKVH